MQSHILQDMANEVESSLSFCKQEPGVNLMVPPQGTALFRNEMGSCPPTMALPGCMGTNCMGCFLCLNKINVDGLGSQGLNGNWSSTGTGTGTGTGTETVNETGSKIEANWVQDHVL